MLLYEEKLSYCSDVRLLENKTRFVGFDFQNQQPLINNV